jgi:hypothetical protein
MYGRAPEISRRRQGEDFLLSFGHGRRAQENDPDRGEHSGRAAASELGRQALACLDAAIADAITLAERIKQKIDSGTTARRRPPRA